MRHHVFVAGVDYEQPRNDFKRATDFLQYADRRATYLRDLLPNGSEARFEIFDVRSGIVKTEEVFVKDGKKIVKRSSEQKFERISEKSYEIPSEPGGEPRYKRGSQPRVLSITDVYRALAEVGDKQPGSLVEFSVFSHGAMGGPILVNSYAESRYTARGLRDPQDKDGRSVVDFISPNMEPKFKERLNRSFDKKLGHAWFWGCSFPIVYNKFFNRVEAKVSMSSKPGEVFEFNGLTDSEIELIEDLIGNNLGNPIRNRSVKLRYEWIKYIYCAGTALCYPHQFARAANVVTYGALLGTYAEFEVGKPPFMGVAGRFFRRLAFYKRHLGIRLDPENRNFGEYDPKFECLPLSL